MTCEVKTADPGREVSWATLHGDREVVRWTYRFEPDGAGTTVTESFDVQWFPLSAWFFEDVLMRNRDRQREAAMRTTLERIKAVAEGR
jgi:hypothetical protein